MRGLGSQLSASLLRSIWSHRSRRRNLRGGFVCTKIGLKIGLKIIINIAFFYLHPHSTARGSLCLFLTGLNIWHNRPTQSLWRVAVVAPNQLKFVAFCFHSVAPICPYLSDVAVGLFYFHSPRALLLSLFEDQCNLGRVTAVLGRLDVQVDRLGPTFLRKHWFWFQWWPKSSPTWQLPVPPTYPTACSLRRLPVKPNNKKSVHITSGRSQKK